MGNPYIGEIRLFGGSFAPLNWSFCNGNLLPIAQYDALYSLLGTTYGGDGTQTFGLPDLRSRIPVHVGTGAGLSPYTLGQAGGTEQISLLSVQIPVHTHPLTVSGATGGVDTPVGNAPATPPSLELYRVAVPADSLSPQALLNAGQSLPHPNIQPTLGLNFIISLFGIYPTQN